MEKEPCVRKFRLSTQFKYIFNFPQKHRYVLEKFYLDCNTKDAEIPSR